jgi:hypothetical protein
MENKHYTDRLEVIRQRMARKKHLPKGIPAFILQAPNLEQFFSATPVPSQSTKQKSRGRRLELSTDRRSKDSSYSARKRPEQRHSFSTSRQANRSLVEKVRKPSFTSETRQFEYVLRYSLRTRRGALPGPNSKPNQDSIIVFPQINKQTWQHFFGVCDGHGTMGHLVSSFLRENLPKCLLAQKELRSNPAVALKRAYQMVGERLNRESRIDLAFSGSTCVGLYMCHDSLFCANVGDSRALLIRQQHGRFEALPLSRDHKPDLPDERQRIESKGGRV